MKTKTKMLAMLEIAIVLCSVFLMAIPAIAAEQTMSASKVINTASEDDYVLGVYGNANEDDTIDMRDLTYVKLIFFGKKPETELANAKYDGKINPLDFIQIKLIIVGKEKELTLLHYIGPDTKEPVTVNKPVKRIVMLDKYGIEAIQILGVQDKIVGISSDITEYTYLPELSKLPPLGTAGYPDIEAILSLNPDLVITWWTTKVSELDEKLPDSIVVLGTRFPKPKVLPEEVMKLGYLLEKKDEAKHYINDFHDKYIDPIKAQTEGLSEEERPKVYVECNKPYKTYGCTTGAHQRIVLIGGKNIFADLKGIPTVDPEEVVMRNPDIILRGAYTGAGYGVDDPSEMKPLVESIINRPELAKVNAIKSESVYITDVNLYYGPDYPVSITYDAKRIHPELFKDLDPVAIHQEYITEFLGLDYDLDEHGVFVYPPFEG